MNIQIRTSSTSLSEKIWNDSADQLLDAQQPLSMRLAKQVFPDADFNTHAGVLTTAVARLRAAHRQIIQALGSMSTSADPIAA